VSAEIALDRRWLSQALALAAHGEGATSPNPRVGCLVVRDGEVVGRGYHRALGQHHAEAVAIAEAGERARGATLYVNLEPCAHHGRTPPCADLIVASGVQRVVAPMQDPNPMVNGMGFARLREAGVTVETGLLVREAEALNEQFLHWHYYRMPLVTLKAALSLDGKLAAKGGRSRWITGEPARRFAHRLRLRHDAVLVGAGTVRNDNPRLTVRLPGVSVTRKKIILSTALEIDPRSAIFDDVGRDAPATRLYTAAKGGRNSFSGRAEVVTVARRGKHLDLEEVLADLAEQGIQSLLVEGGGKTFASFLKENHAHRGAFFYSGKILGERGATPLLPGPAVVEPSAGWRFHRDRLLPLGEEILMLGRFAPPGE
jgi:diaminohydroxyphosphoribosylaminopyrimidine deaminase/5-amino-6-(5-phosphoribosylamino)uracil reductase